MYSVLIVALTTINLQPYQKPYGLQVFTTNQPISQVHVLERKDYKTGTIQTSNVTSITEVQSATASLFASMWRPLVSVITTLLLCCDYFSSSSGGTAHFLCAMRVF